MDVLKVLHPAQLHGGGGVHQHHHVVKLLVEVVQQLQLRGVGLQITLHLVLGHIGVVVHGPGQVPALAGLPRPDKDGGASSIGVLQPGLRLEHRHRALVDGEVLRVAEAHGAGSQAVALTLPLGVEFPQPVVDGEALRLKAALQRGAAAAQAQEAAAAQIGGPLTEEAEGGPPVIGHISLVFQEHQPLAHNLPIERLLRALDGLLGVVRLVVIEVQPFRPGGRADLHLVAQQVLHHHAEGRHQDVDPHRHPQRHQNQDTGNNRAQDSPDLHVNSPSPKMPVTGLSQALYRAVPGQRNIFVAVCVKSGVVG